MAWDFSFQTRGVRVSLAQPRRPSPAGPARTLPAVVFHEGQLNCLGLSDPRSKLEASTPVWESQGEQDTSK